jgi:putative endopeptidase
MFKAPTLLSAVSAPALMVAALSWALMSAAGAQTTDDRAPTAQENGVDASIRPGDDFFAYANGGWLKANEIPAGKQSWSARNEITELTRQRVVKLLADAGARPSGSSARQVADFYAAYMNEAAIEAKGITALKPMLGRIDRVRDKAALTLGCVPMSTR